CLTLHPIVLLHCQIKFGNHFHKDNHLFFTIPSHTEKGKQPWSHFPFISSVSYHQKFVSIIFFLVLSVSAMYGFIVS
ncbi:MAG: hypothetical protein Q4G00_17140, partial [Clostridia bacterium]|nr:hypothetical protein [Clostridia bacterium]